MFSNIVFRKEGFVISFTIKGIIFFLLILWNLILLRINKMSIPERSFIFELISIARPLSVGEQNEWLSLIGKITPVNSRSDNLCSYLVIDDSLLVTCIYFGILGHLQVSSYIKVLV